MLFRSNCVLPRWSRPSSGLPGQASSGCWRVQFAGRFADSQSADRLCQRTLSHARGRAPLLSAADRATPLGRRRVFGRCSVCRVVCHMEMRKPCVALDGKRDSGPDRGSDEGCFPRLNSARAFAGKLNAACFPFDNRRVWVLHRGSGSHGRLDNGPSTWVTRGGCRVHTSRRPGVSGGSWR